jgi:hypothetical protein
MKSRKSINEPLKNVKRGRPTVTDRDKLKNRTMTVCLTPEVESCFSFAGVTSRPDPAIRDSVVPVMFPICKSTLHFKVGFCTHAPSVKVSPASQKSRQKSSKSKALKPKKITVFLFGKEVEQAHFNDYLKQLNRGKKERP